MTRDVRGRSPFSDVHVHSRPGAVPGARGALQGGVPPRRLIRLELHSHKGSTHVALGGEIRWYRQAPDGTHVAGVKFTGTTAQHAPRLLGFATPVPA